MKILIIGSVASGKTTLAKKLSKKLHIDYYEIDSIVHDDKNLIKRDNKEQQKIINEINKNRNWIIEGTLRKNLTNLLTIADKIIYLNIPYEIRNKRIKKRYLKQRLKLEKANYKPNDEMLDKMYLWNKEFELNKTEFEHRLTKYVNKLLILKSDDDIDKYFKTFD